MRILRLVLVVDAAVLILLGGVLLLLPHWVATAFQFRDLPLGVHYIVGLWGCALLTMGAAYGAAAQDPERHVLWVQAGIARGALECLFGLVCVARGLVRFDQAAFGIVAAGLMAVAYLVFYPRPEPLPPPAEPQAAS